jgi:uncharacterized protein
VIRHTFSMLSGIGEKLERRLWSRGILMWEDFCRCGGIEGISAERKSGYDNQLIQSSVELAVENAEYFARIMKRREHWRLFEVFKQGAVCLDIETNGFQPGIGGYVTVVGLYDGYDARCFIRGENLSAEALNSALSGYKYLITFYGAAFDVPFLLRTVPGVRFDIPHFDLCFAARRLGINGGLKKLERIFGIDRDETVRGLDGYDAVKLWERARRGSSEALDLLVTYNREDTIHLMELAAILYDQMKSSTGIHQYVPVRRCLS